jgi:sporulation protein YlmC with PRC-barrel domain
MMKVTLIALFAVASLTPIRSVAAQVAGEATVGVTVEEMKMVVLGWSAKNKMLGKSVYNDKNEKIGKVEDVIVAPDGKLSWAIIGVGGFLGLASKDVAIPMDHLKLKGDRFLLPGATKEALKALPAFHYATT